MMKRLVLVFAACMFAAGVASADMTLDFSCQGSGNMVADVGNVLYSGGITVGDLAPGLWSISIDDTGWPTDPGPRWDYIWNTFYEYDAGEFPPVWTATFDTPLLSTRPALFLDHTGFGTMSGVADMRFQVIDWDGDGILDPDDCAFGGLSGIVIIIEDGTGDYADQCGDGTYQGDYARDCSVYDDDVSFQMSVDLYPCGMATEPSSWGAIKALYY
jgi:hypothetical protein